ncbi:MAG: anthranilate synthase component I [Bacillota bacterium]|nr:MAG: anthranilate synthase component I [Bacillota bacterium]
MRPGTTRPQVATGTTRGDARIAGVRLALDQETPVTVFRKLAGDGPGFLLESLGGGERAGRYSIIGAWPARELVCTGTASVFREAGAEREAPADPFVALRAFVRPGPSWGGLRFAGGAVGYMGYDAVRFLERLPGRPPADPDLPVARFMECAILAVLDHVRHELILLAPATPCLGAAAGAAGAPEAARLQEALDRLAVPSTAGQPIFLSDADGPGLGDGGAGAAGPWSAAVRSRTSRAAFEAAVRRAKEYIRAGDVFQVVLSRRLEFDWHGDPFDLYRALRVVTPSPYMFYLRFDGDTVLLGASPELLVRVEGRRVLTRPLAGTRPRGRTPEEDAALEEELRADPKERAEHTMLVDLGRNDLGKVCSYGTVRVERLMYVERYSHVMHMASDVAGQLAPGRDAVDALAACFPAGTLTGAPKVRAMEIIDELEPVARGPYGGAVGYLGYDGNLDMCIAIRTVYIHRGRGYLQAGAGIVHDSRPMEEWAETEAKARAGLRALALALRTRARPRASVAEPAGGTAERPGPARDGGSRR